MSSLVTVGGVVLQETRTAGQDGDSVRIAGVQSTSAATNPAAAVIAAEAARAAHDNVTGLLGLVVPVVFEQKTQLDGFYLVESASSELTRFGPGGAVQGAAWQLGLTRIGAAGDVEIESRVPTIGRLTDHAVTPVFWHAPAVGASSYFTGSTLPTSSITRVSSDGPVPVHLGIPTGRAPRWTTTAGTYLLGAVKMLFDGRRRVGVHTPPHITWQVDNGLVRLTPGSSGAIQVACWDDSAWRSVTSYKLVVSGAALTDTPQLTVLRNDPEEVAVRLTYATSPGRATVDLSVRRGSRFVAGLLKRHSAATVRIERTTTEAATAVTGGLRATAADGDGNRPVMGTARSFTSTTSPAALSKASTTSLDFFLGHEVGSTPQAGDAFADLLGQYLGSTGERVRVVRR